MKIKEIIEKIEAMYNPVGEKTRDYVLVGDPESECTGVATTCCATLDVMKKCAEQGINFIVSHESIFYGLDKSETELDNKVKEAKVAFAKEHNIVVWRNHDHMHGGFGESERAQMDWIYYGIMKELGWEDYCTNYPLKPLHYTIPETTARELASFLMEKWNLTGLRVVGDPDAKVSKVFICEHVQGGKFDIKKVQEAEDADVLIPLEICDFTLSAYVHDAKALGLNKVILEMGHFNTEELAMKYLAKTLEEELKMPVTFVQSGDYFTYLTR